MLLQRVQKQSSEKMPLLTVCAAALVFAACVGLAGLEAGTGRSTARASVADGRSTFVPELGIPAREVVAFGASPAEAPGEAWAYGYLGPVPPAAAPDQVNRYTLLRHTDADGWQLVPLPGGATLSAKGGFPSRLGALAGQATPAGSLALLTQAGIVTRAPGAPPALVPAPAGDSELLGDGESLPPTPPPGEAPTPYAVVDGADGLAGIFIAPYRGEAPEPEGELPAGILHFDGHGWSREGIERPDEESVRPLAIGCGPTGERPNAFSPDNCWMLARVGEADSARLGIFRREPGAAGAAPEWRPVDVAGGLLGGQQGDPPPGVGSVALAPLQGNAQMLTVTSLGAWVDFSATLDGSESRSASELVVPSSDGAQVLGSWCHPVGPGCERSLGASLPDAYRSFAWPGGSSAEPGTRVITGLEGRALLELSGGSFVYAVGAGGSPGSAPGGAAFLSTDRGFVADGADPSAGRDGGGQSQVFSLTTEPAGSELATEPVPFRHPLLAVAPAPGGGEGGEAMAVGLQGQAARFVPGEGWQQYPTLTAPEVGLLDLRDVAWPTPQRAYAVGDHGELWAWDGPSDTWAQEQVLGPGPGQGADFSSVAFSKVDPTRGFAVAQMNIRAYAAGPDAWQYAEVPAELFQTGFFDLTEVAFAGNEALAGFRHSGLEGGLLAEDGSGWRVDQEVAALLGSLPAEVDIAPTAIAGLPDGGAVVAGAGWVIKRESASAPWTLSPQPLPEAREISALAAYRDAGGDVRPIVSIALGPYTPRIPVDGNHQPNDAPPASGYVLRETANGWTDMQHQALAVQADSPDMPMRPEPVFDLVVDPSGDTGIAVGGQSGNFSGSQPSAPTVGPPGNLRYETAAALRFPPDSAHEPNEQSAVEMAGGSRMLFAVVGHAACTAPCAAQAAGRLGPDVSLSHVLEKANAIEREQPENLRGVIYTGGRLESGIADQRELERLAELFGGAGSLPLLTTPSPDLTAAGPSLFSSIFAPFGPSAGSTYYAYRSEEPGGATAVVIVLDFSSGALGPVQASWLREQLFAARREGVPSIVVGSAALDFSLPEPPAGAAPVQQAEDAEAVKEILAVGGASAYLYDYPGATVISLIPSGDLSIPAIGTGVLGYVPPRGNAAAWFGSNSLLLLALGGGTEPIGGIAGFIGIPVFESLTMHSDDGTRLRTGQAAVFKGLGRRPAAGIRVEQVDGEPVFAGPEPYEMLPPDTRVPSCQGPDCPHALPSEFAFSSSDPAVGDFVVDGSFDSENRTPIAYSRSGLFCAKSAGETTISITAGGMSYSQRLRVTAESVQPSCWERVAQPAQPAPPTQPEEVIPPASEPAPAPQVPPRPSPPPSAPAPQTPPPAPQPSVPNAPPIVAPAPTPTPTPGIVLPPGPVLLQPPAPPVGVSAVNAASPASAPSPVAQGAVSPAERDQAEAAREFSHEARAHRLATQPTTLVASPANGSPGAAPFLPLLLAIGALGAAAALGAGRPRASTATARALE